MSGRIDCKRRIGIFGGSFDPVHLGHTGLAEDAIQQVGLEKVIFIPARFQPFKLDKKLTSGKARVGMLNIAAQRRTEFEVSTFELDSEFVSYTYLTMRAMQNSLGKECRLYFITGTDAFLKIEKWKNSKELLENYSYIIGTRPGYRQEELEICIKRIKDKFGTDIININNTQIDVSSTEIRNRLESGISVDDLVSADVERYIIENDLYK